MKKYVPIAFILYLLTGAIWANESTDHEFPEYLQGLGVAAGHYSGVGMSYKMIYKERYGIQFTASYYSDEYEDRWGMPGVEFQYHLSRYKNTSFYISTGLSYEYIRNEYYYWVEEESDNWIMEPHVEIDEIWTTGLGFGMEAIFFDRISVTAEAIMYYRDDETASIMVQGGLHYYFNMGKKDNSAKAQTSE